MQAFEDVVFDTSDKLTELLTHLMGFSHCATDIIGQ